MKMINQTTGSHLFQTSDLALATTISLWYPVELIDRNNPSKAQFIFKKEDGFDELVTSFWKRELKIEPQAFFSQLRLIKARLYESG